MPSRKRAKGKARKAKQADKASNSRDDPKDVTQLQQLIENMSLSPASSCHHGCPDGYEEDDICLCFVKQFQVEMMDLWTNDFDSIKNGGATTSYMMLIGKLRKSRDFDGVWHDEHQQEKVLPLLLSLGTILLLKDEPCFTNMASVVAMAVLCARHDFCMGKALESSDKSRELIRDLNQGGHEIDTIRVFVKRISCQCLKDRYARAKRTCLKLAKCDHCRNTSERKDMWLCGRCRLFQYCSKSCQEADFSEHRHICEKWNSEQK